MGGLGTVPVSCAVGFPQPRELQWEKGCLGTVSLGPRETFHKLDLFAFFSIFEQHHYNTNLPPCTTWELTAACPGVPCADWDRNPASGTPAELDFPALDW